MIRKWVILGGMGAAFLGTVFVANASADLRKLVDKARINYFNGREKPSHEAMALYEAGLKAAEEARVLAPTHADVLVWWAANKGAIAELKKNLASLAAIRDIEKTMLIVLSQDPNYGFGAADRVLGVLYHQAPGFVSIGSNNKAEKHLKRAMEIAPDFPGNRLAMAEFLFDQGEKESARKLVMPLVEDPRWREKDFGEFSLEKKDWEKRIVLWKPGGAFQ